MGTQTHNLPAGQVMTVTANATSNGSVYRLPDSAGGGEPATPVAVAAGTSLAIGPFASPRRYAVVSDAGLLTSTFSPGDAYDPTSIAVTGGTITGATITGGTNAAKDMVTTISGDGAITIQTGTVKLTKGSAAAITLAAPSAEQEGTTLNVVAGSAFAHVITATGLLDDGVTGGAKNTATFGAFVGSAITLKAVAQKWTVISKNVVTVA